MAIQIPYGNSSNLSFHRFCILMYSFRTLLFLQLIVQVQTQMSKDGPSSSNILSKPEHVFSCIKHALQNGSALQSPESKTGPKKPRVRQGITMDDLRIVPREEQDEDLDMGGDSDDETPNQEGAQPDDEMTIAALNLLLSVLEGTTFHVNVYQNVSFIDLTSKPEPLHTVGPSSRRNS
jgi:hypothetical protein